MKKPIFILIITLITLFFILTGIALVYLFNYEYTTKNKLKDGISYIKIKNFDKALEKFNTIDKTDSLYPEALEYIKKTDSLKKLNNKIDSISKRNTLIKNQFSSWNGSHKNLEKIIKSSLTDPNSYEHIKTVYFDLNDKLKVTTTYRAKNSFNGFVTNTATVYCNLNGTITEFLTK